MFVPKADSEAVRKLRVHLGVEKDAVWVKVAVSDADRERDCYMNVRDRVQRYGGRMQLGWAVWQHSDIFIEAEPHAVYDPGDGRPWIDCTPHITPDGGKMWEILFIPNDNGTYDFDTTNLPDNVRLALSDDQRVRRALELFSEKNALMNSVPGIDVYLPQDVARRVNQIQTQADMLLTEVMMQPRSRDYGLTLQAQAESNEKIGRNDPCPCGSGKKYKKCHGS
jgi:hypothetical protein